MTDWNWNKGTKSIGVFTLDTPVKTVAHLLTRLERCEDESYDTYMIENSNFSKLFVKGEKIYSIQCAQHFVVDGHDLIGTTLEECERILTKPLCLFHQHSVSPDYVNLEGTLRIIFGSNACVLYVIYFSVPLFISSCSTPF